MKNIVDQCGAIDDEIARKIVTLAAEDLTNSKVNVFNNLIAKMFGTKLFQSLMPVSKTGFLEILCFWLDCC